MTPYELQLENIDASRRIYSVGRLIKALLFEDFVHKVLFTGEFFWHWSTRSDMKKELEYLRTFEKNPEDLDKRCGKNGHPATISQM